MDNLTKAQRRKNMKNIRSSGTLPERIVAQELRRRKIYFAPNVKAIIGKPDFVFKKKRVAVFIDSDFWHGHPERCVMPKSNCGYWQKKIDDNKERDKFVAKTLRREGWRVVRIWEWDVKKRLKTAIKKILINLDKL